MGSNEESGMEEQNTVSKEYIEELARRAVYEEDHGLFARLFVEEAGSSRARFTGLFRAAVDAYHSLRKEKKLPGLPTYSNFKILQDGYWCTDDFAYMEEHLTRQYIYNSSALSNWRQGRDYPSRATLFQLAFFLFLSVEKLEDLLLAAGEPGLYILDPMDACVKAYLKKFEKEELPGEEAAVLQRIAHVKKEINNLLMQTADKSLAYRRYRQTVVKSPEEIVDPMEKAAIGYLPGIWKMTEIGWRLVLDVQRWPGEIPPIAAKEYGIHLTNAAGSAPGFEIRLPAHMDNMGRVARYLSWDSRSGKLSRFCYQGERILAYEKDLGLDIDAEIVNLRSAFDPESERGESNGNTTFLTKLFTEKYEAAGQPEAYIREVVPFARKRYGFLRKTAQFLASDRFQKNICWSNLELSDNGCFEERMLEQEDGFLNDTCKRFRLMLQSGEAAKMPREKLREKRLDVLHVIWQQKTPEKEEGLDFRQGKFTVVRNLNQGRSLSHRKDMLCENNEEKLQGYVFDMGSKQQLMKYAVATGNEDRLGNYLVLSGYWRQDWTERFQDMSEPALQRAWEGLSRSDWLILYAISYRDALIEAWSRRTQRNPAVFRDYAREHFPMVRLLLVLEDIILLQAEDKAGKMKRGQEKKIYMNDVWKDLIFSP